MPKRIIDGEAMWGSTKLTNCPEWAAIEYPWLYPLADKNGSFEVTNLRSIWARVYGSCRPGMTVEQLEKVFAEFENRGLLFTWTDNARRYGHWTGSEKPGRLPKGTDYAHAALFAPPVPVSDLELYILGRPVNDQSMTKQGLVNDRLGPGMGLGPGLGPGIGKSILVESKADSTADLFPDSQKPEPSPKPTERDFLETGRQVFAYFCEKLGHNPIVYTWTPKRRQMLHQRAREAYGMTVGFYPGLTPREWLERTTEAMRVAVNNFALSDFHQGRDPKTGGKKFLGIEYCFGSSERMQRWLMGG